MKNILLGLILLFSSYFAFAIPPFFWGKELQRMNGSYHSADDISSAVKAVEKQISEEREKLRKEGKSTNYNNVILSLSKKLKINIDEEYDPIYHEGAFKVSEEYFCKDDIFSDLELHKMTIDTCEKNFKNLNRKIKRLRAERNILLGTISITLFLLLTLN
ncbi:MAG: hypothetical protein CMP11_08850 [Zetaproteobacteria bacterium]|nr:hypothetical protein [Pseudobdellovibrionaceae bacterium]|tara:strand:+ start:1058 stop:1537 length:480 start_codon:yes stop_codon:yes gene_type:complete